MVFSLPVVKVLPEKLPMSVLSFPLPNLKPAEYPTKTLLLDNFPDMFPANEPTNVLLYPSFPALYPIKTFRFPDTFGAVLKPNIVLRFPLALLPESAPTYVFSRPKFPALIPI
ncbi:hypothetical protein MT325_m520R [Paramecium bursaria chlorella virus MT325]|uniref:Uncharacterized protein m520R n=1 Tax=Paramecium bursaria Chlorella virus MT325 TaxID=346932 RepID=A7IUQ0_PBCVM|nr:hypothetical protein MT325_m520R [Paramecium bursaria chlorella virus MT325]